MPGWIVVDELPLRLTEPWLVRPEVLGCDSDASGSATVAAPVTGAGLKLALPLFWTLAVHVDDRGLHRGVAAGRDGARRAGIDVDAARDLDAGVAREATGPRRPSGRGR